MGGIGEETVMVLLVDPDGSMVASGPTYSDDGDVSGSHGSTDICVVKLDVDPALPVALISFTAQPKDNASIELKWVTANEVENAYFEVEKSKDLKDFIALTRISPDEQPASTHTYQYIDELPFQGTSYYRLKQVDVGGTITTYPWRALIIVNRSFQRLPGNGN